jgi:hypothetical protein
MKRGVPLLTILLILIFISFSVNADDVVQNLESEIVESFDDPDAQQWYVRGSKFIAEGYPLVTYVNAWPEAVFGSNRDGADLRVLGTKAAFDRTGYHYLEFFPVAENQSGELEPVTLSLPGRVREIELWAWGANFDYYLEMHIRDYWGRVYVLHLGDLRYVGWRNLKASIPIYIPQAGGHITDGGFAKQLELVKIVLWTRPSESVSGFSFYLDQIKVLTDTYVTRFDGDDLAEAETAQEIWTNVQGK